MRLLPGGTEPSALTLLGAKALRAFGDGYMAVLLPAYLLAIGLGTLEVGIVSTATMLGSALATLAVGAWGYRFAGRRLLRGAALLMVATGLCFASLSSFWPLLIVALVGTLNPSSGDVSVFLPLEHARLAAAAQGNARTALFARYSLLGALCAALGALAAAVPDWMVRHTGLARLDALRGMFVVYAALGLAFFCSIGGCLRPAPAASPSSRHRWAPRAASWCAWQRCSASMPSPVDWWSTR
ncbi:MFS transporter [Polaromonas sp. P1(28)-13]|nr:MFS transporter [Polaromonas sp. P1(28)-13]